MMSAVHPLGLMEREETASVAVLADTAEIGGTAELGGRHGQLRGPVAPL